MFVVNRHVVRVCSQISCQYMIYLHYLRLPPTILNG